MNTTEMEKILDKMDLSEIKHIKKLFVDMKREVHVRCGYDSEWLYSEFHDVLTDIELAHLAGYIQGKYGDNK